jgi:pyruvate kinase
MRTRLSLELRVGDRVEIDDGRVVLVLEQKSGQRARFRVEADEDVPVCSTQGHRRDPRPREKDCIPD